MLHVKNIYVEFYNFTFFISSATSLGKIANDMQHLPYGHIDNDLIYTQVLYMPSNYLRYFNKIFLDNWNNQHRANVIKEQFLKRIF